jgi:hypothetical protein
MLVDMCSSLHARRHVLVGACSSTCARRCMLVDMHALVAVSSSPIIVDIVTLHQDEVVRGAVGRVQAACSVSEEGPGPVDAQL